MLKIQRYRRIAEAIKVKESELERLQTDYDEMLKRREETEQQLETKQIALLTDNIQAKQVIPVEQGFQKPDLISKV